jgi:hypothetical protein
LYSATDVLVDGIDRGRKALADTHRVLVLQPAHLRVRSLAAATSLDIGLRRGKQGKQE